MRYHIHPVKECWSRSPRRTHHTNITPFSGVLEAVFILSFGGVCEEIRYFIHLSIHLSMHVRFHDYDYHHEEI